MKMNKIIIVGVLIASLYSQLSEAAQYPLHCDTICNEEDPTGQICGTDGVTYASKCELENAVCKAAINGSKLGVSYEGQCITMSTPCDEVLGHTCPHRIYSPSYVCGTDGRTYISACLLATVRCKSLQDPNANMTVDLDHMGPCEQITNSSRMVDCSQYVVNSTGSGAIALEPGARPPRIEIVTCTREFQPVCTLDSHTYSNECAYCHSLAIRHMITSSNLTATISHDGMCIHVSTIIG